MYTKSHCLSRSKSCDFINLTQHLYSFENSSLDNIQLPNLSAMHENTRVRSSRPCVVRADVVSSRLNNEFYC